MQKKDNLKSIIVLSVICLVIAVAMAAVNFITAPVIKDNDEQKVQESLKAVMPEASGFEKIELSENAPKTVQSLYRDNEKTGYVVAISTESAYSSNPMTFSVAFSNDGKVMAVELTGYSETKDFGKSTYPKTYVGKDGDKVSDADLVSGVTYSSTAFRNAMADAFAAVAEVEGGLK